MFQSSTQSEFQYGFSFTDEDTPCCHYENAINGSSLLIEGAFISKINSNGKWVERSSCVGDMCDFYRNLNIDTMFSCKQRKGSNKGLVTGYAPIYVIDNPSFFVGTGRQRVLSSSKKNVHAFVRGELINAYNGTLDVSRLPDHIVATYNPYYAGYFFDRESKKAVKGDDYHTAIVFGANVYLLY